MHRFRLLLLGMVGFLAPLSAGTTRYYINFTLLGGWNPYGPGLPVFVTAPTGGSFLYDPSISNGFSDFQVQWNGQVFDLTQEANTPITAPHPGQCAESANDNWTFGFAILSQQATGCNAVYFWDALAVDSGSLFDFRLIDNPPPPVDLELCDGCTGARISGYAGNAIPSYSYGTWTISPEPGTAGVLLAGIAAAAGIRRAIGRRV